MRIFLSGIISLFLVSSIDAQKGMAVAPSLRVNWTLAGNNHAESGNALASFSLINTGKKILPAAGWTIYFNSSQPIPDAKTAAGVFISHVNGDIYKLRPGPDFRSLKRFDSVRLDYFTNGRIINYTAAPSGAYIVWDNNPDKGWPLTDYSVTPLKQTVPGLTDAATVYNQNKRIKDMPEADLPPVFPTPAYYKMGKGRILLDQQVRLDADTGFQQELSYLKHTLTTFGLSSGTHEVRKENRIRLIRGNAPENGYRLQVNPDGVTITAAAGEGIFYGIQSLFSLMSPGTWKQAVQDISLPCVELVDSPRFNYRSLMLDVARNFKSKETVFKVLDLMAFYKLNILHLHFTDDEGWRIEIPGLPELTEVAAVRGHTTDSYSRLPPSYASGPQAGGSLGTGYYSRKDFIEILRYATERHIEVIPEIESPGHSRAAIKAMDARYRKQLALGDPEEAVKYLLRDMNDSSVYSSAQQWTDNVICVAMPSVYRFQEKVINALLDMYKEAGAVIHTIHMGGDEVPAGAWEKSPVCQALLQSDPQLNETNDLWYYYYQRMNDLLKTKGLFMSGWEEAGMRKTKLDGKDVMIVNPRFANEGMQLHVWNNVTGWGNEDLPYKLANAGYKVVLSPVSNNYLDLAYYKHPDEPGYYWGGFQDIDKPFYFNPFDYYKTSKEDPDGNPVDPSVFAGKERLTDFGKSNIVGIQGLLWAENLRTTDAMEYLLLPKLLAVAERAWASTPAWVTETDTLKSKEMYLSAWSVFLNQVGKRELPRLDYFAKGFNYRIPSPGIYKEAGKVWVNCQFPGLQIRYTVNGGEPGPESQLVNGPVTEKGILRFRVFDSRGRGSRTELIEIR